MKNEQEKCEVPHKPRETVMSQIQDHSSFTKRDLSKLEVQL